MIVRLVTMNFAEGNLDTFLTVFNKYKSRIRGSEGCEYLSLIQNTDNPNEISTLSHWTDEESLNNYRNSKVFKEVWPQTKPLFTCPPKATSYQVVTIQS